MNIYWFESSDGAVRHVIAAHNKERAENLLKKNEIDMDPTGFTLVGVSHDVEKKEGALALGLDNDTRIYDAPQEEDPRYDEQGPWRDQDEDSEEESGE